MGSLQLAAPRKQRLTGIGPEPDRVMPYEPTTDSGGWVASPRRMRALLRDKTSGAAQMLLLLYLQELLWGDRGFMDPRSKKVRGAAAWTKPIPKRVLARECGGLTERAMDPVIEDAVRRGMIAVQPVGRDYRYALLPAQWDAVPDYVPPPPRQAADQDEGEERANVHGSALPLERLSKGEETANVHGSGLPRSRVVLLPGKPHTVTLGAAVRKVRIESDTGGAAHHEVAHGEVRIWFEAAAGKSEERANARGSALPGGTNLEVQIQSLTILDWAKHLEGLMVTSGLIRTFGEAPNAKFAGEIQKLAGRATLSHFDATFHRYARQGKVRSLAFLRIIAEQCAAFAHVWAKAMAPKLVAPVAVESAEDRDYRIRGLRAIIDDPAESDYVKEIARGVLRECE